MDKRITDLHKPTNRGRHDTRFLSLNVNQLFHEYLLLLSPQIINRGMILSLKCNPGLRLFGQGPYSERMPMLFLVSAKLKTWRCLYKPKKRITLLTPTMLQIFVIISGLTLLRITLLLAIWCLMLAGSKFSTSHERDKTLTMQLVRF